MQAIKSFFKALGAGINYINNYFKTFVFLFIVFYLLMPSPSTHKTSFEGLANLEKIELKGTIIDAQALVEKIILVKDNPHIKGVLFFIDSPGGAFAPSMELALAIKDLKAKKPVVVYASGTMASGSYLAGVAADEIIANPASFIGSIGVIVQGADLSELAHKLGIKTQVIKAGEFKEAGTFTRAWSSSEKEFLQDLVQKSYTLFTDFVAKERKLKLEEKDSWANARVFLSNEALQLGLIDKVGNLELAKKRLAELSNVQKPIFAKPDPIDKFLEKLDEMSIRFMGKILSNAFHSVS